MSAPNTANTRELLAQYLNSIRFIHPDHEWKDNRYSPVATRMADSSGWVVSTSQIDIVIPDQDVEFRKGSYVMDGNIAVNKRPSTVTLTHISVKATNAKDVHIVLSERVYQDKPKPYFHDAGQYPAGTYIPAG